ncbi:MAG: methyl-accepting chemotaxis protein [Cyanobacteriota bacterium]|nr:methyl-accepting chemotaxis protein [Cyanobacteriota bacterium]
MSALDYPATPSSTSPSGSRGIRSAPPPKPGQLRYRLNSIGSRLFLYVLGGALLGLGGMSFLFYQALQQQAEDKIQGTLATQVAAIDGELIQTEQTITSLIAAVNNLKKSGIKDKAIYKNLAFEYFRNSRSDLTIGIGFGQGSNKIIPDVQWYWPYFYEDQGAALADAVGVLMPPPYQNVRDAELHQYDQYASKDYYKDYVLPQKPLWPEPYPWAGIALASYYKPIFAENGEWLGVAATDINIAAYSERIGDATVFEDAGYFVILSKAGNLIAYPPAPDLAKNLQSYQELPDLNRIWPDIQGDEGLLRSDGQYWAYQRIPTTEWAMLAVVPQSVVLQPVLLITLAGTLGAGILLAGVVILFVRQLNQRLDPILQGCREMSAFNSQRVGTAGDPILEGRDELEVLSRSFSQMATQLKASFSALEQSNRQLEQRVEARTADLQRSEQRLRRQNEVLALLARDEALVRGDLGAVAATFTEAIADTLEVERVSIWLYSPDQTAIQAIDLYVRTPRQHSPGSQLKREDHPAYFAALDEKRTIAAQNAHTDPATQEFSASYLTPLGITSMLDAPILVTGQLKGVVCCEHVGSERVWAVEEQGFVTSTANLIALALEATERLQAQQELSRSEQQQRMEKESLQKRAMELLMEVDPVSQGDLRVRARVTPDEIGTIADSYNAIISSLRDIVVQVQASAQQVTQTAASNETSVKTLSVEALQQADALATALQQIEAMVQSIQTVAQRAQQAEVQVQEASQTVSRGDQAMNRTVSGILAIRETVAETAKKVKRLGEASQKISKVVSLINNFAAQTNLLSLNAAIEAARAGEQGRGFAVVAEEVRSLAQQSSTATGEIEQLVEAIQRETNEVVAAMERGTEQVVVGTQLVEETRQQLSQITRISGQILTLVEEVVEAAASQAETSATVSQTIQQVTDIARQTSTQSVALADSFGNLLRVAQQLQVSVSQFKLDTPSADPSTGSHSPTTPEDPPRVLNIPAALRSPMLRR